MTEIMAHRGSRINRPENTLAAFEEAVRAGADGIELDVHLSQDGQVVVIHDETVDRTTNGSGLVHQLTLTDIKNLDAGAWFDLAFAGERIPTLLEVLELLEGLGFGGRLNIELKRGKNRGMEKKINSLLQQKNWPFEILFSSFSLRALWRLHRLLPVAEVAYLIKKSRFLLHLGKYLPWISSLHIGHQAYFQASFSTPKKLRLWTINDEGAMNRAFQLEVEAIITDKPEVAKAVRETLNSVEDSASPLQIGQSCV